MLTWLQTGAIVAATFLSMPSKVSPDQYPEQWNNTGANKTFVLYRKHNVKAMSQGQVGSCVGTATAKCLEMMTGEKYSAEWCYAASRNLFGKVYGPGSQCGWSAESMKLVGGIPCANYSIMGFDLSRYDASLAYSWERGPPESLEWIAARHRIRGYVKIKTWEQLRDAIANEHPVIVGSSVGFGSKTGARRDSTGMLHSRWWSRWNHAMVICGVSDGRSKRALLLNSWGTNWIRGPKWLGDEPSGSFWISKRDAEKILSNGDSYALLPMVE